MTKQQRKRNRLHIKQKLLTTAVPDRVLVSLKVCVFNGHSDFKDSPADQPTVGNFNRKGHCHLQYGEPSKGKVIRNRKKNKFDIITKSVRFSCGRALRSIALRRLGLKRMPQVVWEQSDNCLSAALIKMLKEKGISISSIRIELYKCMDAQVREAIIEMASDYGKQFKYDLDYLKIEAFIKKAEICNDLSGAINCELSREKGFISRFCEVIHNEEVTYFFEGKKYALPPAKPGVDKKSGAACIKQIRGFCKNHSILKAYLKSIDKQGSLNRLETVHNENALDFILLSRKIFPFDGKKVNLSRQLKCLSKIHISRCHRVLAFKPLSKKPLRRKIICRAIADHCGSKFVSEIKKSYLKWKVVSTSSKSILTAGAKRNIRLLAKQNILFKKYESTEYKIDNKWLNEFYR